MKRLKEKYPDAFVYAPCDRVNIGLPDIFMFNKGKLYCYEIKVSEKKLRPEQDKIKKILTKNGAKFIILYGDNIE
ncbi:MAG: hypothetical protein QXO40_00100 [Candidatus Aenigmatarchaeota archaeon]